MVPPPPPPLPPARGPRAPPPPTLPYSGNGFDWSPDGTRLVIASGSSLTFVSADGSTVATLVGDEVGPVAAPYWTQSRVLFVEGEAAQLLAVAAPV